MLNLNLTFVQLHTKIVAALLIVLAMFTVHQDIAQASSWDRCGGAATITGTVLDPEGDPISGIFVTASVGTAITCPGVATDETGTFTITDLPADTWTISFGYYFLSNVEYGSPEPVVVTVADGETVALTEPIQMKPPAAFAQIVLPEIENGLVDSTYHGQIILNPYSPTQNANARCGGVAVYGPATVRQSFITQEIVYIPNLLPGAYCLYVELREEGWESMGQHFGAVYQAPAPRVVEIPADSESVDLGAIALGLPPKRITIRVVDEEGVGAAGVYIRATQSSHFWGAYTDQAGEAHLALSDGSWEVMLESADEIILGDTVSQTISFAANGSVETETAQFQVQRVHSAITGRLVRDDGAPLPDGTEWDRIDITAWAIDESGNYDARIDEGGRFTATVPAGTYKIITYAGRLEALGLFTPVPYTVTVASEQVTAVGDVKMIPAQVTATVQDAEGNPLAETYYRVLASGTPDRLGNTDCTNTFAFKSDFPPRTPVVVYGSGNEDGLLQIGSLPPGEYCLLVRYNISAADSDEYYGRVTSIFTIESEASTVALGTLVAEPRSKRLTGRITQADGTGIPGFPIRAQSNSDRGWASIVTAADGSYELSLEQGAWTISIGDDYPYGPITLNDVTYRNHKWFADGISQTVTFANDEAAETQQLDWPLPDISATIRGVTQTSDGAPITGAADGFVVARMWQQERTIEIYRRVDPATGSYTLPAVEGNWSVQYVNEGPLSTYSRRSERMQVMVGSGETVEQNIPLLSFDATVRGQLLYADGTPVPYGGVYINASSPSLTNIDLSRTVEVINGEFEVNVQTKTQYNIDIGTSIVPNLPPDWRPAQRSIYVMADEPQMITIQLPDILTGMKDRLRMPLFLQP